MPSAKKDHVHAVKVGHKTKLTGGAIPCSAPVGATKEHAPGAYESCMLLAKKLGPIDDPRKVYDLVWPALSKEDQEVFLVIPLDIRLQLKSAPRELFRGGRASIGTVDRTIILGEVLRANASAWVAIHNHPSGVAEPSQADKDATKEFRKASEVAGLTMVDHIVVAKSGYYSFTDDKLTKI